MGEIKLDCDSLLDARSPFSLEDNHSMMNNTDRIKAMHLRELYRRMGWFSGLAVRDAYRRLSPEQRSNVIQYARQLRAYMNELADERADQTLLEMACLMPGAMRGEPMFMAEQSPEKRPLYASELREGREWLLKADKMATTLRELTPEQWRVLLPRSGRGEKSMERPDATADVIVSMLDSVLPDTSDDEDASDNASFDAASCSAYAHLSVEEGRAIAQFALSLSSLPISGTGDIAEDILLHVACFVPDGLKGLRLELARRGIFSYSGVLYKGAGPKVSRLLIRRLDEGRVSSKNLHPTLVALAWIGDEAVRSAFRRWQMDPPPWREKLHVSPAAYAHEAGWELTESGGHRHLVSEACYPLVPSEESLGPVSTINMSEVTCGGCGQTLVTLLDLDLTDPRLGFLDIQGQRLRVATCDRCGLYSRAYFTKVNLQGGSEWSSLNEGVIVEPGEDWPFYSGATRKLVLGGEPKGPLEALICWEGGSQIGGYPGWVQDADYPECPECGQTMRFIGQLVTDDFMGEPSEGTTFCLICPQYHMAATVYQQT
jgi:predicted nucleic-acid-binding Zn-ribbon protein